MKLLITSALLAVAAGAFAQSSFLFSGDTRNQPTFFRPDGIATSQILRQTRYQATSFTVTASGAYTFEANFPAFDGYLLAYQDSFNPNDPLANLINGDDDFSGSYTLLTGSTATGQNASRIAPGDTSNYVSGGLQLTAGRTYVAVVTSFADRTSVVTPAQGVYNAAIGGGPGNVQAVPEPATLAALGLGAAAMLKRRRKQAAR